MKHKNPMPEITYNGMTYKLRSRNIEIPDIEHMDEFKALIWINMNTTARGYSKASNPLTGMAGAVNLI